MPALLRDGAGLRSCPRIPRTTGLLEMGPKRSCEAPRARQARSREVFGARGEQTAGRGEPGDFLPPTRPDLVMSFNSLLATGFLPALLRGEGPLVPVPAQISSPMSPFPGLRAHTCTHILSQGHDTTVLFQAARLPGCRGHSQASPSSLPFSLPPSHPSGSPQPSSSPSCAAHPPREGLMHYFPALRGSI